MKGKSSALLTARREWSFRVDSFKIRANEPRTMSSGLLGEIGDKATDGRTLMELHGKMASRPVAVDLPHLLEQLGVRFSGQGIVQQFDAIARRLLEYIQGPPGMYQGGAHAARVTRKNVLR